MKLSLKAVDDGRADAFPGSSSTSSDSEELSDVSPELESMSGIK